MSYLAWNGYLWLAWLAYWCIAARFVNAAKSSEDWLRRLIHLSPMGLGLLLIFQWADRDYIGRRLYRSEPIAWLGMGLTAAGLLFAVWARVHLGRYWSGIITLKEDHDLIRTGPYRWVRHPIYTGFVTATLGSALVAETVGAFIGFALVLLACMLKIRREETVLVSEFGDQYRAFQSEVAALVPFIY
jgi:protein-S-isoprenylcysteine O-methyltransferase Ste14